MIDFKLDSAGDLEIGLEGDIYTTESVVQAVMIRLKWFFAEWRLGPQFGFPYFEEVFIKNPNLSKIKFLLRQTILSVDEVTKVKSINISVDKKTRAALIQFTFETDEETYNEEVTIHGD